MKCNFIPTLLGEEAWLSLPGAIGAGNTGGYLYGQMAGHEIVPLPHLLEK